MKFWLSGVKPQFVFVRISLLESFFLLAMQTFWKVKDDLHLRLQLPTPSPLIFAGYQIPLAKITFAFLAFAIALRLPRFTLPRSSWPFLVFAIAIAKIPFVLS